MQHVSLPLLLIFPHAPRREKAQQACVRRVIDRKRTYVCVMMRMRNEEKGKGKQNVVAPDCNQTIEGTTGLCSATDRKRKYVCVMMRMPDEDKGNVKKQMWWHQIATGLSQNQVKIYTRSELSKHQLRTSCHPRIYSNHDIILCALENPPPPYSSPTITPVGTILRPLDDAKEAMV